MCQLDPISTAIPGLFVIRRSLVKDNRGYFSKIYSAESQQYNGLNLKFVEQYYSQSNKNVLRGMHFQTPPHDHEKLVTCISGAALDVVVDLRIGSPTFRGVVAFDLASTEPFSIYIPKGLAHGFLSLEEKTILHYAVTSTYMTDHDSGISWNSIDFEWPTSTPIISSRDSNFESIQNYESPFKYLS